MEDPPVVLSLASPNQITLKPCCPWSAPSKSSNPLTL